MNVNCAKIRGWAIGGQVFDDFIIICTNLNAIQNGQLPVENLEQIKPHLLGLTSRLNAMQCNTPLQRYTVL